MHLKYYIGNKQIKLTLLSYEKTKGSGNRIKKYKLEYFHNNTWHPFFSGANSNVIKIHRFDAVWATK